MTHTHFVGVGGIGMSALAHILLDQNRHVSGSDRNLESKLLKTLSLKGASIYEEDRPLDETVSRLVLTSDALLDHPRIMEAKRRGIPLLHRSELLHELMKGHKALLVSGTHGKTTTSSLLAHVLTQCGLSPSYAIGGIIKSLGGNGGYGKGDYFVAESDESDGSFSRYSPWGGIITNIDNDHLAHWKSIEALIQGFKEYIDTHSSKDHTFWCCDDDNLRALAPAGISYGFSSDADLQVISFRQEGFELVFDLAFKGNIYSEIALPLIGGHNVLNAAAVFGLALQLKISQDTIRKALMSFKGVERRADFKGMCKGASLYDDYGHHPTEIFATLRAIKAGAPNKRIVVVFQPHRYSRTLDCMEDFKDAFHDADMLILTDIYAAGEDPIPGVSSEKLLEKIKESYQGGLYLMQRKNLAPFVLSLIGKDDIVVTLGAGDITNLSHELEMLT